MEKHLQTQDRGPLKDNELAYSPLKDRPALFSAKVKNLKKSDCPQLAISTMCYVRESFVNWGRMKLAIFAGRECASEGPLVRLVDVA